MSMKSAFSFDRFYALFSIRSGKYDTFGEMHNYILSNVIWIPILCIFWKVVKSRRGVPNLGIFAILKKVMNFIHNG